MKILIKHRVTATVLFEHKEKDNSIKKTLEAGVQVEANLEGANLEGAIYSKGAHNHED